MRRVRRSCPGWDPSRRRERGPGLKKKIVGFHTDEEGHWVAELECGHRQHVRHDPPLVDRPWVLSPEGRKGCIGLELDCKKCEEAGPADVSR